MAGSLILSFDVEHFPALDFQGKGFEGRSLEISLQGLGSLTKLLAGLNAKATFFVTAEFSLLCGKELKELASAGHEIACHGYSHSDSYLAMEPEKAADRLSRAKALLEKSLKAKVSGFRAPRMQLLPVETVKGAGFSYDSSLNPIFLPGHYNNFFRPRKPFSKGGLAVMPVSAAPIFRLPFSFVFFKSLGPGYAKLCSRLCLLNSDFLHLYFHPWDFAEVGRKEFPKLPWYLLKNNGKKSLAMLESYIRWCRGKSLEPKTISGYLAGAGFL